MRRLSPILSAAILSAAALSKPADAQPMPGMDMDMPGMGQGADAPPPPHDHGAMDHMDHDAMPMAMDGAMPGTADAPPPASGTALPAGDAPAPPPPADHYADRAYGAAAMAASRAALGAEHGGGTASLILFNLAEYQARRGRDGYRWDGEAWFGGDIDRLTLKSEGEGDLAGRTGAAEVQALYSRALDPYWNLQAGLRYDIRPRPSRVYAALGVEGLAPYWFAIEAALFVSGKGDVIGRIEGYHDMRLTQRLVLQPRAELNLSAQDMPAEGIGSGLADAELGLRLRYEVRREFAPYLGLSWERKAGDTARFARAAGERAQATSLVLGIRGWF